MQQVFVQKEIADLKQLLQSKAAKKVFVVRGNRSYSQSGAKVFIDDLLSDKNVVAFSDFAVNPQLADVSKGIEIFKKDTFDLIVAIGGGSALDMAKLISVFAHQQGDFEAIVKGAQKMEAQATPVLAIPTTAGTGAEATHFAVVYMGKTKYSVAHELMLPSYVYLSAIFSTSANAYLTACTGLDAFCQAVESAWSVGANDESLGYALEAIEKVWNNLSKAVGENNKEAKEQMQIASYLAGKAINITKTTAPHALSYAFTSYYGIPHGHAVALSLPYFLKFNFELDNSTCVDARGVDAVKERITKVLSILNVNKDNLENRLVNFFEEIGVSIKIKELAADFNEQIILDNVNVERLSNNPRKVTLYDIKEFLTNN